VLYNLETTTREAATTTPTTILGKTMTKATLISRYLVNINFTLFSNTHLDKTTTKALTKKNYR
jgi:hypothetical protein